MLFQYVKPRVLSVCRRSAMANGALRRTANPLYVCSVYISIFVHEYIHVYYTYCRVSILKDFVTTRVVAWSVHPVVLCPRFASIFACFVTVNYVNDIMYCYLGNWEKKKAGRKCWQGVAKEELFGNFVSCVHMNVVFS